MALVECYCLKPSRGLHYGELIEHFQVYKWYTINPDSLFLDCGHLISLIEC